MTSDAILQKVMKQIAAASASSRISEISRLTKLAERVSEIQKTQQNLAAELSLIESALGRSPSSTSTRSDSLASASSVRGNNLNAQIHPPEKTQPLLGPLAIDIDWEAAGKPHSKQIICERKASDTLRAFFESIRAQFGDVALEKLSVLHVNRAPPLSRRPEVEFLNRKRGIPYQHQRLGGSDWHVLTHSSTPEKIDLIRQVARSLGFPPGAITAREIDVQREIRRLVEAL